MASITATDDVAYILVPGSFTGPPFYSKVADILSAQNKTVISVTLKAATDLSPEPPATMDDDADHIHSVITNILDSGKNVVLVMSSYGGIPGSQAVKGLSREERGPGKKAVIALVYIAALLLPEGKSLNDRFADSGVELVKEDGESEPDPYMHLDERIHKPATFNDMSKTEANKYWETMGVQTRVSFENKLSYAGWKHIPSTYIHTTADQIVSPAMQEAMLGVANEMLRKAGSKEIKTVAFEGSGHIPVLSRPEESVKVFVEAAREAGA